MNVGDFPIFAFIAFLVVAILTPTSSFVRLKKKRHSTVDISSGRSVISVFFTELSLCITILLIVGVLLLATPAVFILAAGFGRVAADESVPLVPIIIMLVVLGGLAFIGFVLDDKVKMMLIALAKAQSNNSLNRSAG